MQPIEATPINEEEIRAYIQRVRWQESKDKSHSYTLVEWAPTTATSFYSFVQSIRDHGYTAWFYGKTYFCFDLDGRRYWTMGASLEETILINRATNDLGDPHRQRDYPNRK